MTVFGKSSATLLSCQEFISNFIYNFILASTFQKGPMSHVMSKVDKRRQIRPNLRQVSQTFEKSRQNPGGGTQIWFGRECAADAAKPLPVFRGHFG